MGGRTVDHGIIVGVKEEDEEEESLSLCDLPMNEGNNLQLQSSKESSVANNDESQEEFNFCDSFSISREYSEMCAADELFFQGQILPLRRHSVSCTHTDDTTTSGIINGTRLQSDHISNAGKVSGCRCSSISRSDSLDRCYSGGLTSTAASSRSSSINSHRSSSSGSSTATTAAKHKKPSSSRPPRLLPNHFQYSSQPSPKPQIRTPSGTKNSNPNSNKNSGLWSLFRVGLMTPPEIAIRDLKNRSNSIKNYNPQSFGSRNSTSSNSSTTSKIITPAKRKQPFFFNKNGVMLFGGCKCTASSVVGPNPSRISHDVHRRSEGVTANAHEEDQKQHATKMTKHHQQTAGGGKQALSRHRTFEWLKQLSLEAAAMDQT